ncbi:MAG: ATP-binding protein [Clostridia bacterium]|nr:ATP-binding protein [Clostridia bacterium]
MKNNYMKRKIDLFLENWKNNPDHKPLIVQGARQIGKTESIKRFAKNHYEHFIEINFALQEEFRDIFDEGYEVDRIIKAISFINPSFVFVPRKTLILFDEIQIVPRGATSLKSFREDGRFDVICSGSLMGINYQEIESNAVGNKEDYFMKSMDFEEFLWAKGYREDQIEDLFGYMKEIKPLPTSVFNKLSELFRDYLVVGGMPEIVKTYVKQNNFSGILDLQKQIIRDYEEDITKYAGGLDKTKILSVYRKIPVFLGNENKKFFISKVEANARSKNYVGVVDWLVNSGIVNISYCLESPSLPLKGHYDPDNFRLYFMDTGLLIGALDDEAQADLRNGKNFNTCKGAIFENVVGDMLVKAGYGLFFYKDDKGRLEMDFFVRDSDSLIPVEVKANDGATISLRNLIEKDKYSDVKYGIKLGNKNIGFNGQFYTFPYFLTFLLKRFLKEKESDND